MGFLCYRNACPLHISGEEFRCNRCEGLSFYAASGARQKSIRREKLSAGQITGRQQCCDDVILALQPCGCMPDEHGSGSLAVLRCRRPVSLARAPPAAELRPAAACQLRRPIVLSAATGARPGNNAAVGRAVTPSVGPGSEHVWPSSGERECCSIQMCSVRGCSPGLPLRLKSLIISSVFIMGHTSLSGEASRFCFTS